MAATLTWYEPNWACIGASKTSIFQNTTETTFKQWIEIAWSEFRDILKKAWWEIDQNVIDNLIRSFHV
jgi:hypothetical protein